MKSKIVQIVSRERKTSARGKEYVRTIAILEGGEEVSGFGEDYSVGQTVISYFDDHYGVAKMTPLNKPPKESNLDTE